MEGRSNIQVQYSILYELYPYSPVIYTSSLSAKLKVYSFTKYVIGSEGKFVRVPGPDRIHVTTNDAIILVGSDYYLERVRNI